MCARCLRFRGSSPPAELGLPCHGQGEKLEPRNPADYLRRRLANTPADDESPFVCEAIADQIGHTLLIPSINREAACAT